MTNKKNTPVKVGDRVIIGVRDYGNRVKYMEGTVDKAARVWVLIKADGGNRTWRMRQDTRSENTGFGFGGHFFRTPEQHEQALAATEARAYLVARGIEVHPGDFSSDAGTIKLAAAVKALLNAKDVQ